MNIFIKTCNLKALYYYKALFRNKDRGIDLKPNNDIEEKKIGKRIILNAVKMEESLADLLKAEAKIYEKPCVMMQ